MGLRIGTWLPKSAASPNAPGRSGGRAPQPGRPPTCAMPPHGMSRIGILIGVCAVGGLFGLVWSKAAREQQLGDTVHDATVAVAAGDFGKALTRLDDARTMLTEAGGWIGDDMRRQYRDAVPISWAALRLVTTQGDTATAHAVHAYLVDLTSRATRRGRVHEAKAISVLSRYCAYLADPTAHTLHDVRRAYEAYLTSATAHTPAAFYTWLGHQLVVFGDGSSDERFGPFRPLMAEVLTPYDAWTVHQLKQATPAVLDHFVSWQDRMRED